MRESRRLLRDDQWVKLEPLLPGKPGDPGATAQDNRLFLEAVLWIVRTGSPWRDLPAELGNRGVTHVDGKIFVGRIDGNVVALDAKTGKELWVTKVNWHLRDRKQHRYIQPQVDLPRWPI